LDEVDGRIACGLCDYRGRVSLGTLVAHGVFCNELPGADHRGATAEREGRGSCGCFWWRWQPDGVWSAWSGNRSFASDDVVRGDVYGLCLGNGCTRGSRCGLRRVDPPEIFQACARSGKIYSGCTSSYAATSNATVFDATTAGSGRSGEAIVLVAQTLHFGERHGLFNGGGDLSPGIPRRAYRVN
jgi:hypothetical protein